MQSFQQTTSLESRTQKVQNGSLKKQENLEVMDEAYAGLYDDLRLIAMQLLYRENRNVTLSKTDLVHEAYLKLSQSKFPAINDRGHFYALLTNVMKQVLVEHARKKLSQKRGEGEQCITLEPEFESATNSLDIHAEAEQLSDIVEALDNLARSDAFAARIVEFRFFIGMSLEEIAQLTQTPTSKVYRKWLTAKSWLSKELGEVA